MPTSLVPAARAAVTRLRIARTAQARLVRQSITNVVDRRGGAAKLLGFRKNLPAAHGVPAPCSQWRSPERHTPLHPNAPSLAWLHPAFSSAQGASVSSSTRPSQSSSTSLQASLCGRTWPTHCFPLAAAYASGMAVLVLRGLRAEIAFLDRLARAALPCDVRRSRRGRRVATVAAADRAAAIFRVIAGRWLGSRISGRGRRAYGSRIISARAGIRRHDRQAAVLGRPADRRRRKSPYIRSDRWRISCRTPGWRGDRRCSRSARRRTARPTERPRLRRDITTCASPNRPRRTRPTAPGPELAETAVSPPVGRFREIDGQPRGTPPRSPPRPAPNPMFASRDLVLADCGSPTLFSTSVLVPVWARRYASSFACDGIPDARPPPTSRTPVSASAIGATANAVIARASFDASTGAASARAVGLGAASLAGRRRRRSRAACRAHHRALAFRGPRPHKQRTTLRITSSPRPSKYVEP